MATEKFVYLTLQEAVKFHVLYMRKVGETRFGVFDKTLIESALARPRQAARYENADLIRQAATLCFGLIKNHPLGRRQQTHRYLFNQPFSQAKWLENNRACLQPGEDGFGG